MRSKQFPMTRRNLLKGASSAALLAGGLAPAVARAQQKSASGKTLRVLAVEDPFFFSLKAMIPDFEKQTGVKVQLESLSYDALQARLVSAFVANTSDADVIAVDQMWLGQYLDNGWLIPLDDFIVKDQEIDLNDFIPQVLHSSNVWKGQIGTLPVAAYAQGVIYRKDMFDTFGIAAPPKDTSDDWTWDSYVQTLKSIDGKEFGGSKIFPTVICGSQPSPIVHMFTQLSASHGAEWFKSFPRAPWDFEPTLATKPWADAADAYRQLYKLSPPESVNYVWFDAGTRFAKGDIAMFYWWTPYFYLVKNSGYMTGNKSDVMGKYAAGALPKAKGVDQTISLGGWSLGVPSSSDNHAGGYDFIRWATSKATQKKMALWPDLNYQFSDFARASLYKDEEIRSIYPYLDVQLNMMHQGNGKVVRPPVPGYTALESVLGLTLNQLLTGSEPADVAMKRVNGLFESILKSNFMIPYEKKDYDDTLENTKALVKKLTKS